MGELRMDMTGIPENISGTYRIECTLGAGGSGVVYKAWHSRLHKYVVIKEDMLSPLIDMEARRSEVEALKNIRSMYVPQVFDFLTDGDRSFTVIEYVEGVSFDKLLVSGRGIAGHRLAKLYWQLASALKSIHRRNVCHRDIKPSNIMLTPEGDVYLIDFNSALVEGNSARLFSRSPGYASPEQYELFSRLERAAESRSEPDAVKNRDDGVETILLESDCVTEQIADDVAYRRAYPDMPFQVPDSEPQRETQVCIDWKRSDIYSLGATMYHLLTGKRPTERAGAGETMDGLDRSGGGIGRIIERSMRRDPSERFSSAGELAGAIRDLRHNDPRQTTRQTHTSNPQDLTA